MPRGARSLGPKGYSECPCLTASIFLRSVIGSPQAAAISRIYAPDVRWTDDEGVSVGHDALEARAQKLQQQSQGLVFTKASPVYQTLNFGYLAWHLGPEGGAPVASGFDVAIIRNDVIAELYTVITK